MPAGSSKLGFTTQTYTLKPPHVVTGAGDKVGNGSMNAGGMQVVANGGGQSSSSSYGKKST